MMQFPSVAVLLAAVAVAAPHPESYGVRYTDHHCKKLHSLPNRNFGLNDCIELRTVGSIKLSFHDTKCRVFQEHQCKGDNYFDTDQTSVDNQCFNINGPPSWEGYLSFRCFPGHD